MALITLKDYSIKHGKSVITIRKKAQSGGFKTAIKIGRDWLIEESEPYIDLRIKSGQYKNWRKSNRG